MYHKGTFMTKAYYDTYEEMPNKAKVYFPGNDAPVEMTADEICALDDEGWYTIMHSVNWGCCDHWTSEKPSKWVKEKFNKIIQYTNGKGGDVVGYDRMGWSITLTKESNYWKAEVWNS